MGSSTCRVQARLLVVEDFEGLANRSEKFLLARRKNEDTRGMRSLRICSRRAMRRVNYSAYAEKDRTAFRRARCAKRWNGARFGGAIFCRSRSVSTSGRDSRTQVKRDCVERTD